MNLHLKSIRNSKNYIHFEVRIGKIVCGELCMKKEDAQKFHSMLAPYGILKTTGNWR